MSSRNGTRILDTEGTPKDAGLRMERKSRSQDGRDQGHSIRYTEKQSVTV